MTDRAPLSAVPDPPDREPEQLSAERLLQMHDLMLTSRVLEERLIRMQKQGDGYFWIGGPGEEAFNTALGLLVRRGQGLDHDFLHLHYRASATCLAMGFDPVDTLRQMRMKATDPYSGGRNFVGHFTRRDWNVCPVSSPIEVQFSIAIGTAIAQARDPNCRGITLVQGGDAGTAEGDFASCLVWASRPGRELPLLMVINNNGWGISTAAETQHGENHLADRGKPFGIRTRVIDGNDPEESFFELQKAFDYVREERKPFLLEAHVSRLYGHSSSSGSNYVSSEVDCLSVIEARLEARGLRTRSESQAVRDRLFQEMQESARSIRDEPTPDAASVDQHVFAPTDE